VFNNYGIEFGPSLERERCYQRDNLLVMIEIITLDRKFVDILGLYNFYEN